MSEFTDEQSSYINNDKLECSKLYACAGSGKTRCIIFRMDFLIRNDKFKQNEILMLTFSRFTRDDFINKIAKYNITTISESNVKTIDSFAKTLIDKNNEIDVSLLSYRFLKYLQESSSEDLKQNKKLSKIKIIFVDEAQDLNEIQYNILLLLKEKINIIINLIGDSNQNIYQFRQSNDKYLSEFNATIFRLTKNFRSKNNIINFSKFLRPNPSLNITGTLGDSDNKPMIIFHEDDIELEKYLIGVLNEAEELGVDLSEIAIMAPTRGRMKSYGNSNGLCLVSNLLYKNNIKFKQFYEETTDNFVGGIKYKPEVGYINLLTYMGSKGLEWKYVILVDANVCLINKKHFTDDKHKHDQYLLYVACSRAIENVIIFSRYRFKDGCLSFQLNPWFSMIPKKYYTMDSRFGEYFKFPQVKPYEINENIRRIPRLIDQVDEKSLDELSQICNYVKVIKKIYTNHANTIESNMFLGRYVENLFQIYYRINNGLNKKRYIDLENITDSKHIIINIPSTVYEWFYTNRDQLTWETFDKDKKTLDKIIVDTVEARFSRDKKLSEHTIVNDGYFKSFILSMKPRIKTNYDLYLKTKNKKKIRSYLFNILIVTYALETQHYFHALNNGKKFRSLLKFKKLFDDIENFSNTTNISFVDNNVQISKWGLIGEIDLLEKRNNEHVIWEIKCVSEMTLKHVLQVLLYNMMYFNDKTKYTINIINFLKGELINITINLDKNKLTRLKEILNLV